MADIELMAEAAREQVSQVPATLDAIREKANELVAVEQKMSDLTAQLKELSKQREYLRIRLIPDMMASNEIFSIGVGNKVVEVEPIVEASVPKDADKLDAAISFLTSIGEGGNVRRHLDVELPQNNAVIEDRVVKALTRISRRLKPRVVATIHPQTYKAIARRLVANGTAIPEKDGKNILGIFVGRIARVSEPE